MFDSCRRYSVYSWTRVSMMFMFDELLVETSDVVVSTLNAAGINVKVFQIGDGIQGAYDKTTKVLQDSHLHSQSMLF